MPELPEVEHARRSLERWLDGATIARAKGTNARIFRGKRGALAAFSKGLAGRRLEKAERRGKVLLLFFSEGTGLLSHLGMTGKWERRLPGEPLPTYSHARLELEGGATLHYTDPRQFGRLSLHSATELHSLPEVTGLGPDALLDGVDPKKLGASLNKTKRPVKSALLDQGVLAGIGNIYATDALFRARLHPERPASSLTRAEIKRLAQGLEQSISEAISRLGDDIAYFNEGAHVENGFLVYGREGEPCPRCGRPLERLVVGGRSNVLCPFCQPAIVGR